MDRPRAQGLVHRALVHGAGVIAALSACASMSGVQSALGETSGVANPADQHCLDNQYDLVHVHDASGVPVRSFCIDRKNNRKCESWAYYRGECSLEEPEDAARKDSSASPELRSADETQDLSVDKGGTSPSLGCYAPYKELQNE